MLSIVSRIIGTPASPGEEGLVPKVGDYFLLAELEEEDGGGWFWSTVCCKATCLLGSCVYLVAFFVCLFYSACFLSKPHSPLARLPWGYVLSTFFFLVKTRNRKRTSLGT